MTKLEHSVTNLFKYLLIWEIGGAVYYTIEILYRGHSHPSMFIVGGICLLVVGFLNEFYDYDMYFEIQVVIGDIAVVLLEFISGCIVNLYLKLDVWDYSDVPGNLLGQICPQFALLWIPIIVIAILADDWVRHDYFGEEVPKYRSFIKDCIGKLKG